jgi:hypothetical protein
MAKSFKLEYSIIDLYQKLYADKYGNKIDINKYKEKWAFSSLIEDYGYDCVCECLNYYFRSSKDGHPLSYFFFNFDHIKAMMDDKKRDEENRMSRRIKTQELVREYLNGIQ